MIIPTQNERFFDVDDIIVSKTDLRGVITYANDVFLDVALYKEHEILNQPHNIIRHPDMPACVFKLLWDTIQAEKEIFAYVKNMAKNGDFYWVYAHVTPSYDPQGRFIGYHSNRRVPHKDALEKIIPLYQELREVELSYSSRREGMEIAYKRLSDRLAEAETDYERFVFSLSEETSLDASKL